MAAFSEMVSAFGPEEKKMLDPSGDQTGLRARSKVRRVRVPRAKSMSQMFGVVLFSANPTTAALA